MKITATIITLNEERHIARAIESLRCCDEIVLVDSGGRLVYLERIDETQHGSVEVATQKAQSAVAYKRPTKAFEDAVITNGRTVVLNLPGAMPIEGGIPLVVDGKIVGAIGVSGVTSQQDGIVAKAGADALPKILGK